MLKTLSMVSISLFKWLGNTVPKQALVTLALKLANVCHKRRITSAMDCKLTIFKTPTGVSAKTKFTRNLTSTYYAHVEIFKENDPISIFTNKC